jgi:hypothetical protein
MHYEHINLGFVNVLLEHLLASVSNYSELILYLPLGGVGRHQPSQLC